MCPLIKTQFIFNPLIFQRHNNQIQNSIQYAAIIIFIASISYAFNDIHSLSIPQTIITNNWYLNTHPVPAATITRVRQKALIGCESILELEEANESKSLFN